LDGRGKRKRFLLKPIDKIPQGGMNDYPGRNLRERRSSLVKVKLYWPSLSSMGEGRILLLTLAVRNPGDGGFKTLYKFDMEYS